MQIDSDLGEYDLQELESGRFVWSIKRNQKDSNKTNLCDIINWWNDSGFGKRNWMHLNFDLRKDISKEYFVFELIFADNTDAMAFKLRWL